MPVRAPINRESVSKSVMGELDAGHDGPTGSGAVERQVKSSQGRAETIAPPAAPSQPGGAVLPTGRSAWTFRRRPAGTVIGVLRVRIRGDKSASDVEIGAIA
jgi:hypothetical protein